MRNFSVIPVRFAVVSLLALVVGCPSVILLHPNDEGSGGAAGGPVIAPVDGGADTQVDAGPCSVSNLADGLVAYYPFDGNTSDATGHGLNGVPSGSFSFVAGQIGQAISFNATGAMVTVAEDPLLDTTEEFSLAVWVNPAFYPTKLDDNPVIISKLFSADIIGNYAINVQVVDNALLDAFAVEYVDTSGDAGKLVADGVWVTDDPAAPKWIPPGVWTQLTATFKHGTVQLFLDGKLVAQKETKVPHTEMTHYPHEDLIIGNTYSVAHDYGWHGAIDDVRIYGRALTAEEAACLASM